MSARVWTVHVRYADDDPGIFGPYTEREAERVAAVLRGEVMTATGRDGISHHPYNVENATAMPFAQYDQFLAASEIRAAVRAADREQA